jgi:hypothetical protein
MYKSTEEYGAAVNMAIAKERLERAAPALLEALELAREEIKILLLDAGVVFPDQQETICRIDAAIAAAKGE